jgi:glycine cleavage system H protein
VNIPTDLRYTSDHEWVREEHGVTTVGVTQFAADALGDVVFVALPSVGDELSAGDTCGEVESTKSVSDLNSPADGTVVEVNDAVVATPELINNDPFGEGWLFRMRVAGNPDLLDAQAYRQHVEDN